MLEIEYTYTCFSCGKKHSQKCSISFNGPIPNPRIPFGWTNIGCGVICEDHKIEIVPKQRCDCLTVVAFTLPH